jgi:hypothetical protein
MVNDNPESFADLDGHTVWSFLPKTPEIQFIWGCNPDLGPCAADPNSPPLTTTQSNTNAAGTVTATTHKLSPLDKVAMAAERKAIKRTRAALRAGRHVEYSGLIIQSNKDGSLTYTEPAPGGENSSNVDKIPVPEGFTVVGEYHTHPHTTHDEGEGPSPQDIYHLRTPERASRMGYVVDSYSGAVYRYTQTEPVKGPFDVAVYGTKIGTIPDQ